MKLSDYLIDFLVEQGVTHVFGFAGGAVTHLLDSMHGRKDISFISTYHEQAAAFAAEGYARAKGGIGVALATSGPGATNLITGIGSAFFDSIPCLYITGQVNTYEYKGNSEIRQVGFQETDIISIVKPITKYAVRITDPRTIKFELQKAITIANSGRKGPVLLDIPMDIQRAEIIKDKLEGYNTGSSYFGDNCMLPGIINWINGSLRPVILAGGGIRSAGACELLSSFAGQAKIPVVCSLMGLDACDNTLDNYFGLIGAYGNRYGNFILANSDLIIVLGSRLDTRQTGTKLDTFAREAKIIRVDVDKNELQKRIKPDEISIEMDVYDFLKVLNGLAGQISVKNIDVWLQKAKSYKDSYPSYSDESRMNPNYIMHEISAYTKEQDILCLDVGQNQIWAAQSLQLKKGQRLLVSGGMGAMGFSLPAAIGAYYACPDKTVISFCGDGGLQMNIQELQLLKRNNIPVKIIIMNNNCLGMIRHFQEMYFGSRYEGTIKGYEAPDFCKIAGAYGIESRSIKTPEELQDIAKNLDSKKAIIFDIQLGQVTYVFPKLAVNKPIEDQEPLLGDNEFYSTMIVKPIRGMKN